MVSRNILKNRELFVQVPIKVNVWSYKANDQNILPWEFSSTLLGKNVYGCKTFKLAIIVLMRLWYFINL